MLIEDGVNNDRYNGSEVSLASYFDQDDDQSTCLEDRAVAYLLASSITNQKFEKGKLTNHQAQ